MANVRLFTGYDRYGLYPPLSGGAALTVSPKLLSAPLMFLCLSGDYIPDRPDWRQAGLGHSGYIRRNR